MNRNQGRRLVLVCLCLFVLVGSIQAFSSRPCAQQQQQQQPRTTTQQQQQQPHRSSSSLSLILPSWRTTNHHYQQHQKKKKMSTFSLSLASTTTSTTTTLQEDMEQNLQLLYRAADTKLEDSDAVYEALTLLEKQMRQACQADSSLVTQMQSQLTGSWQLIFTTGTAQTQERQGRRINYFPLKAIQSFNMTMNTIENGIYFFDTNWCVIQFLGLLDFDVKKRRLNFDFDTLQLANGFVKIPLQQGEAASFGAKTGLGSESNVVNAQKKKKNKSAFFNWISADDRIATARGGGGGLALWKRI